MFLLAWTCFGPRRRAALRATKPNISARDAPESLVSPSHPPTLLVLLPDVPTVLIPATPSLASRLPGPPRCPVCPTAQLPRVPWPASLIPLLPGLLAPPPPRCPRPVISAAIGELGGVAAAQSAPASKGGGDGSSDDAPGWRSICRRGGCGRGSDQHLARPTPQASCNAVRGASGGVGGARKPPANDEGRLPHRPSRR